MTDWKKDLERLHGLYENIERLSDEEITKVVIAFLAHVPNHIAAAKKLVGLGPIEDIFKVGVLDEDD
jgi:predicted metallopeptidase